MVKEFVQWPEYIIEDIETIKALADARRIRILEELVTSPRTAKELGAVLEEAPSKLYYHINMLERHGLIQVVDTRIVSGIVEKHYQSVAKSYQYSQNLLADNQVELDESLESLVLATIDKTRDDIRESLAKGVAHMSQEVPEHQRVMAWAGMTHLSAEEHESFMYELRTLIHKYEHDREKEPSSQEEETQLYNFYITFFPKASDQKQNKE